MRIKPRDTKADTLTIRKVGEKKFPAQIEAVNAWATGWQVLLFKSKADVLKWCKARNITITNPVELEGK